jgi:hypothetical protein
MELSSALDEDVTISVHEDIAHGRILEKGFEWPEPEDLVLDLLHQKLPLFQAEQNFLVLEDLPNRHSDVFAYAIESHLPHTRKIEQLEELIVHLGFELLISGPGCDLISSGTTLPRRSLVTHGGLRGASIITS